jgi:hypothetical protein
MHRSGSLSSAQTGPNDYIAFVESFNHNLKVLVRDLSKNCPADATLYRAKERTMTVIAVSPLFVIDSVGPYLYKYHVQIYALEAEPGAMERFFLENDFDTELKASVNQEKADLVKYVIPRAKEYVRTLAPEAKREYGLLIVALLDDYLEYLAARPAG